MKSIKTMKILGVFFIVCGLLLTCFVSFYFRHQSSSIGLLTTFLGVYFIKRYKLAKEIAKKEIFLVIIVYISVILIEVFLLNWALV
ncbi:hypothetical protein CN946_01060 [Bacillus sp. AFS053548]|nr:hypothetical protein CN946_01060 [Bacillus sp. AFS053548]